MTLPPDSSASPPPPPPPSAPPPPLSAPEAPAWNAGAEGLSALGSPGARLGAAIIDSIVVFVPLYLLLLIVGDKGGTLVGILYLLAFAFYAPLMMARTGANNGQTVGKQVCNLRVVRESGEPMTFGSGLLREAVGKSLISAVTCGIYGLLDSLWCLWDPRKQCLHDKVGTTLVLQADADPRLAASIRA